MNLGNTSAQAVGETVLNKGFETFSFKIGSLVVSPNYIEAGLIIFLIFFLIIAMARMHRLFIHWSFKGAIGGVLIGFLLCLIIEGFFVVSGSTILTSAFGWKNAPKPVQNVLDAGKSQFTKVLGTSTQNCNP